MSIFNIYDQAHMTRLVQVALKTRMEELNPLPRSLYTLVPTTSDKIKMEKVETKTFGHAVVKAFGASPNVYVPRVRYTESEVELLPMHEKSPVDERLLRKLEDPDPEISQRAGADTVLRATAIQARNELGWDIYAWQAITTGYLDITFKDEPDQGLTIDYGMPPGNHIDGSDWSNPTSAVPLDDIKAVQLYAANLVGDYAIKIKMNSNTMRWLIESDQAKELLTESSGRQKIPTIEDITTRLYEPSRVVFEVSDSGYRDGETYERGLGIHTKWLADGQVLFTTADPFEGEPLVEVFEGRTAVPVSEFAAPDLRTGPQTWVKLDTDSMTTEYHFASTRIPRVNRADCIFVLDASPDA